MLPIPNSTAVPSWISEYVPQELVDSTLFRFDIQLQVIESIICKSCKAKYTTPQTQCSCGGVKFERSYKHITVDILPDLDLDYERLPQQMQQIPAMYAFWSTVYSEAKLRVSVEERRMKAIRGKLTTTIQNDLKAQGLKLTVEQVKAVIEADDELVKADMKLQQAQMQCGKLWHMLQALEMKADIARSLLGLKRQEFDRSNG